MKKSILKFTALAACVLTISTVQAQQENPRGIYKMTRTTIKSGETVKAPIDQYKLCGDNACPMLIVSNPTDPVSDSTPFELYNVNQQAFNYTGDRSADELGIWIFDSNAEHFTLKWYCPYPSQPWLPEGGWVTEWYERNVPFSPKADWLFSALMNEYPAKKGDFNGLWDSKDNHEFNYWLVNDNYAALCKAEGVDYQYQIMRLTGLIGPLRRAENDKITIANDSFTLNWIDDNTVELIMKSLNVITLHRTVLPPAYLAFFKDFKK